MNANRIALVLGVAVLALGAGAPAAAAAEGDQFSVAPAAGATTAAQAFPQGPDAKAFWAGVCDLAQGTAAVGTRPATPFAHCIEQRAYTGGGFTGFPSATVPPLAAGPVPTVPTPNSGPNEWYTGFTDFATPVSLGGGPSWRLADITQAGAHPDGTASSWFSRSPYNATGVGLVAGDKAPDGAPRTISVKLPPGVVGNPNAVPKCPASALTTVPTTCPPKTQVGVSTVALSGFASIHPVYNVEPRDGKTAEFIVSGAGKADGLQSNIAVTATARTDEDFGVEAMTVEIPTGFPVLGQSFTFWGVPWAKSHDKFRPIAAYCGPSTTTTPGDVQIGLGMLTEGLVGGFGGPVSAPHRCSQDGQPYNSSWGRIRPFLASQTSCSSQNPVSSIRAANWHTSTIATATSQAPLLNGCQDIAFPLSFGLGTTTSEADAPSGLDVDLTIPQNNDPPEAKKFNADDGDPNSAVAHWKSPAGLARSHLKDSVVTLPAGYALNPSAATGLVACSDEGMGVRDASTNPLLFNDGDPFDKDGGADGAECPDGSIIGTAEVITPLLEADEPLTGEVVLGEPKSTDPSSGQMLRMFLVVRNSERALVAKIHGTATADGSVGKGGTGQLRATFENNPQLPFDSLTLHLKGGQRGLLATPQRCGNSGWTSTFTPWSGGADVTPSGQFSVASDCGYGFAPALQAGMSTPHARSYGSFSFRFSRTDGQQWFKSLTATLPKGLLASVRGLIGSNLCSNAQAAAGTCPAASRIGAVDAKAGSGDPFVLEQKGEAFLTEGYKGGEYGLAVKVRGVAGPFRGAQELSPIIVRQAIHVDRTTAQVTAVSDDFPTIWHGVPLRVREVTVKLDRDSFTINPSNCGAKQIASTLVSVESQSAGLDSPFGATGCTSLPFKPNIALQLTGRKQTRTGGHPGVKAVVTQTGTGEAGIKRAEVRLPKSLALDPDNAQALCENSEGIKDEPNCPAGSIVGRARATSPLLNEPLVGNVYFVKNVRKDPTTGNLIRTLPMLVVALRGEIAVNLKGTSNVKGGKLVNVFDTVPDAPISRFNLNINGGKNGILVVTRTRKAKLNLCKGKHVAEADTDGQNGKRHDFDVRMKTPCPKPKAKTKKAKR